MNRHFIAIAAALVACMSASHADARPVDRAAAPAPASELREGKRFTVLVAGKGPDVVLIPGLSSPREVWDAQRKALAGRYRLHLVQVRGFGGEYAGANASGPVLEPFVRELADYIDDMIVDQPGGRPPAIVGHSMGGLAAMMIAARYPQLTGRLMVVDALPFFGTLMMPGATVDGVKERAAMMRDATLARADAAKSVADTPVTSDPGGIMSITPEGRIRVANWSRKADMRVVAQAMYDDIVADLRPEVGKITAKPFTVVYATGAGPQAEAIWTRDYAGTSATLVPVSGSYHFVMVDQPEAFARALDAFLSAR